MLTAVLMTLFLCLGGCGVKAATYLPTYYSCPAFDYEEAQFRSLTGITAPELIPTKESAEADLERAPDELKRLATNGVKEVFETTNDFQLQHVSPFVKRCCDKPTYGCSSVDIPLRYVRYWGRFCYVVHPYGNRAIKYKKCTCLTCVHQGDCPAIGRCVERDYVYSRVIAYCPSLHWPYRWVKLLVRFPTSCQCMTRCPYYHYPYLRKPIAYQQSAPVVLESAQTAVDTVDAQDVGGGQGGGGGGGAGGGGMGGGGGGQGGGGG